jgi:hypothetical protein
LAHRETGSRTINRRANGLARRTRQDRASIAAGGKQGNVIDMNVDVTSDCAAQRIAPVSVALDEMLRISE